MLLNEARKRAKEKANERGETVHVVQLLDGGFTAFFPFVGDIQTLRKEYVLIDSVDED